MCGIVGFVNGETGLFKDSDRMMYQLLWSDSLRGFDSTGVMVATGDHYQFYKRGLTAPDYLRTLGYEKIIKPRIEAARVCIGHNRAATKTSVSDENAHPFVSNDRKIILVHNGFIENANALLPQGVWVTVDSNAIPLVLEDKGEKPGLELLRGAYALAWYNTGDQTLNLARNAKRTLYFGYVKGKNTMVFGSEWLMLHWIMDRNGIEIEEWKDLPTGELFKFKASNPRGEVTRTVFQSPPNTQSSTRGGHIVTTASGAQTARSGSSASGTGVTDAVPTERRVEIFLTQIEHLTKQERFRCGIPKSKAKLERLAIKLGEFGYRLGETVEIDLKEFSLYKNQRELGVAFGHRSSNHNVRIRMPGMTQNEYIAYKGFRYFYGHVVGIEVSRAKHSLELVCVPSAGLQGSYGGGDDDEDPGDIDPFEMQTEDGEINLPNGEVLTYAQFLKVCQEGCSWCSGNLLPDRAAEFMWIDKATCLCQDCANDKEVLGMLQLDKAIGV